MRGIILDFAGEANISAAVAEYVNTWDQKSLYPEGIPGEGKAHWTRSLAYRTILAKAVEDGKGIPREAVLAYFEELHGNPVDDYIPEDMEDKSKGGRWSEIMQAARDVVKGQPQMIGNELISAVNVIVEPDLTESEEDRVLNLVSPKREKKKENQPPPKGPQNRPPNSPGKGMVTPFPAPGIPHRGSADKDGYLSKKDFFCKKYCDMADAAHWRAFVQAVTLVRSDKDDSCIKEIIGDEYPNVDIDMVLKAAKDFVKRGAKDPYIGGGTLAIRLVKQGNSRSFISTIYRNMQRGGVDQGYLEGFRACFQL